MRKMFYAVLPLVAIAFIFTACDDENEPRVELPTAIKDYISQNYGDYKIDESETDTLCNDVAVYEV